MCKKMISVIVILTFFAGVSGCATFGEEHKGATTGAGIGAATGAVAGALLGSKGAKTEMALLGGLAGALAGGLIGHYAYDQKRTTEKRLPGNITITHHRVRCCALKTFLPFLPR